MNEEMPDEMTEDMPLMDEEQTSQRNELLQALEEYPGYEQPEERRISDESMRAALARILEDFLSQLESLSAFLISREKTETARQVFESIEEIERLQGKIDPAPYAIAPFFFIPRLSNTIQEDMLRNDWQLLQEFKAINEILQPTLTEETDFESLLQQAQAALDSLATTLEQRFVLISAFQG